MTQFAGPMSGRTVLVTGATGGIGEATALGLVASGAHVAITGRDRGRTEAAARGLRAAGSGPVDVFVADMSDQSQVRAMAAEILQRLPRIDVLVNNVGGFWNTRHVTADGLERTFALNHLAPFLLTNLLLDRLRQSPAARVVTVSSNAHTHGPDRLRRPPGRTLLLGRSGLQPVQAGERPLHVRAGQSASRHLGHRQRPAPGSGAHLLRGGGTRRRATVPRPPRASVHEEPRPGSRHLHPSRVRPRSRARHRSLLRQQQGEAVGRAELRPGGSGSALEDKYRPGPRRPRRQPWLVGLTGSTRLRAELSQQRFSHASAIQRAWACESPSTRRRPVGACHRVLSAAIESSTYGLTRPRNDWAECSNRARPSGRRTHPLMGHHRVAVFPRPPGTARRSKTGRKPRRTSSSTRRAVLGARHRTSDSRHDRSAAKVGRA